MDPMFSVVIPAHNEEQVIARCLRRILAGARPGELEVIVVCNGCSDRTRAIAESFGPPVRVLELPVPSKTAALNLADMQSDVFPRIYVDADIEVDIDSLRRTAEVLERGDAMIAAPRLRINLDGRPWRVRAYWQTWVGLPYVTEDLVGSGVYGMSSKARARFDRFPETFSEDLYVRCLFWREERTVIEGSSFTLHPPLHLRSLIRALTRMVAANSRDRSLFGLEIDGLSARQRQRLRERLLSPRTAPAAIVYLSITLAARLRARWQRLRNETPIWERDETARSLQGGR